MTPCEKLGYKVGDKFRSKKCQDGIKVGQIMVLYEDDGSSLPLFNTYPCDFYCCDGEEGMYWSLKDVEPLPKEKSALKDMKIRINSPEHSEQVQKALFELGYSWALSTGYAHTGSSCLYSYVRGCITHGVGWEFDDHEYQEYWLVNGEFTDTYPNIKLENTPPIFKVGDVVLFNKEFRKDSEDYWPHLSSGDIKVKLVYKDGNAFVFLIEGWKNMEPTLVCTSTALPCMFKPLHDKEDNATIYHYRTKNMTRGGLTVYYKDGKIGVARCSMNDVFCKKVGSAIAEESYLECWGSGNLVLKPKHEFLQSIILHQKGEVCGYAVNQIKRFLKEDK